MKNLICDLVEPLPKEKQQKKLFWFYAVNFLLAIYVENFWGMITPKFDNASVYIIILGFLLMTAVEIFFLFFAVRHIESVATFK